jgi:hypothetical protein
MVEQSIDRPSEAIRRFKYLGDGNIVWGIGMLVERKIVETIGTL